MDNFDDFDLLLPNKIFDDENDTNLGFSHLQVPPPKFKSSQQIGSNNYIQPNPASPNLFQTSAFAKLPMPTVPSLNIGTNPSPLMCDPFGASVMDREKEPAYGGIKGESGDEDSKTGLKRRKMNYTGMSADEISHAKRLRRREQIAKASRLSRARRKQELLDLREENKQLKVEREAHLRKISELKNNVESLRDSGEIDVLKENQHLRAQLEQHKTFISCFKHLCDDNKEASVVNSPTESLFNKGATAAHEHVVALLSQSVADNWKEVIISDDISLPYEDFSACYKLVTEFGYSLNKNDKDNKRALKQRLNVRLDILYEGIEADAIVEFLWSSLSSSSAQKRLYNVKDIEVVQLENDSISSEKNTKLFYYREKNPPPTKDNDWVVICNNRERQIPSSILNKPQERKRKNKTINVIQKKCTVLSLSTTQHSAAPEVPNTNRINSFFLQGATVFNEKANTRLSVVFSFPDDFKTKMISGFDDIIMSDGKIGPKFANVINELYTMLNEQDM